MNVIDSAHYRTELCLAINGDWLLMRDGGVIAWLAAVPGKVTEPFAACGWGVAELATRGIAVTEWVNGMDRPEHDSGHWVAEPWDDVLAVSEVA